MPYSQEQKKSEDMHFYYYHQPRFHRLVSQRHHIHPPLIHFHTLLKDYGRGYNSTLQETSKWQKYGSIATFCITVSFSEQTTNSKCYVETNGYNPPKFASTKSYHALWLVL